MNKKTFIQLKSEIKKSFNVLRGLHISAKQYAKINDIFNEIDLEILTPATASNKRKKNGQN